MEKQIVHSSLNVSNALRVTNVSLGHLLATAIHSHAPPTPPLGL